MEHWDAYLFKYACLDMIDLPKRYFDRTVAPFIYKGDISKLILDLKYHRGGFVCDALAPWVAASLLNDNIKVDVVVPVPLSKERKRERGFNQAEVLARAVNAYLGLPIVDNVLARTKNIERQERLGAEERKKNAENAFACVGGAEDFAKIRGKRVLLIDDVITTGATANDCARALKKSGAKTVVACAIAKTEFLA
jgi:ComF family protein